MSSLSNDLDRFLKSDGLRILIESGAVRIDSEEPLAADDTEDFADMDLDHLDADALEDLLEKAEDLLDDLNEQEPEDEGSEEHELWEDRLSETEDFIERTLDRLDDLEDNQ